MGLAPLRVVLLDDEPAACSNLAMMLKTHAPATVEVVGAAFRPGDAESYLNREAPDALFLDIQMPGENAFQFLERLHPFQFDVVFVTAFESHAVQAFRLNAVDYLLKPLHVPDLLAAVERLQLRRLARRPQGKGGYYQHLIRQFSGPASCRQITLRDQNEVEILDLDDVLYLEALGSYCKVHFRKAGVLRTMTMSYTLAEYEEVLPADSFFRVHKSFLVNSRHMQRLLRSGTTSELVLSTGIQLPVGRRRLADLLNFLAPGRLAHG